MELFIWVMFVISIFKGLVRFLMLAFGEDEIKITFNKFGILFRFLCAVGFSIWAGYLLLFGN